MRRPALLAGALLLLSAVLSAGAFSKPASTSTPSQRHLGKAGAPSPEQVKRASAPWGCPPVYAVPASAAGAKLAFINPGPADPYVAAWSHGYKAAAKFYHVGLKEAFLGSYDFSKLIDTYRTISSFDPDVVGALADAGTGRALKAAVEADRRKLVFIDTEIPGGTQIGLPNELGGRIEGQFLKKAVVPLLTTSWKSKPIVVVGLSLEGCQPCEERVDGAFSVLKTFLPKSAKYVRVEDTGDNVAKTQTKMRDLITAHPGAVFVVASLDDETGGGAFNAIRQAKIEARARTASLGGDNLAITNLSKHSPTYVASVDAKPFCEAWNWVEAALAVKAGKTFKPYRFVGVITPQNVHKYRWRLKVK